MSGIFCHTTAYSVKVFKNISILPKKQNAQRKQKKIFDELKLPYSELVHVQQQQTNCVV
jgi:hypothetical protein